MFKPHDGRERDNSTGILDKIAKRPDNPNDTYMASGGAPIKNTSASDLDSNEAMALHRRLMGHYVRELDRQGPNRREMARDEDFYDNEPYTPDEKRVLEERGQLATNFNVISTTINWVIGTERRGRTDYKILPRRKEGSQQAERKTSLMKYISDANRSGFYRSKAFESMIKAGVGWLEAGWQADDDGEPVYDRYETWRNMLHDSMAVEDDMSDGRYMFRSKWMDQDDAQRFFPKRAALIRSASNTTYDFGGMLDSYGDEAMDSMELEAATLGHMAADEADNGARNRVRMMEAWFRVPVMTRTMAGGDFAGELYDDMSDGHMAELDSGRASMAEKVKMRMFMAVMTTSGLLHLQESPYRHNKFPFTALWAYKRSRDNMPYGMIRGLRDLQTHINRSAAKAQYILSTNKTIMEKGAVDDLDQYEEEAARPDAIIVVNPGKKLDMNVDKDLAPAHLDLMSRMISMIQQQSGVTDESLGRTTNATSGKAIIARQEQGALSTAPLFDNLLFSSQIHGEKMLANVEQFFTDKKSFRITNQRGSPSFVDINDGLPENAITMSKADFIISEDDWNATHRQAQVESLMNLVREVAPGAPQILMILLDLIVDMMDIPSKDEVVKRVRQVTGMKDPDADPNAQPTPEEEAAAAAKAEEQALMKRGVEADIALKEAGAAEKIARTDKTNVDAKKLIASLAGQNIETQQKAFQAAIELLTAPQVAEVADAMLIGAGYTAIAANEAKIAQEQGAQEAAMANDPAMAPQLEGMPPMEQPQDPMAQEPAMPDPTMPPPQQGEPM